MESELSTLPQEIETIAEEEIKRGGFKGKYKITEFDSRPSFEAGIELPDLDTINFSYNPEYEKENPKKTKIVAKDCFRHEIDHRKYRGFSGVPRTIKYHAERFIEPIAEVLKKKAYSAEDFHYIANALQDSILHSDLNRKFSLEGIASFFEEVGNSTPDKKFTQFYEAHVKLNLMLWGNKKQKKALNKYFTHDKKEQEKIKEALQNFIQRTGISELEQTISIDGVEKVKDRNRIRDFLNNEENWQNISTIYAEEFSKLMSSGYAMPIINHSGKGTKGRPMPVHGKSPVKREGNEFDKEMYRLDYKKGRIQRAYEENKGVPPWIESYEALDTIYQLLAQRLEFRVQSFTQQMQRPAFYYGARPFNPETDNFKRVTFGFDEKGKIALKKKKFYESEPLEQKVSPKGFPEIRFGIFDVSGSMQESPQGDNNTGKTSIIPWGDNSKYHYQALAFYGELEYLRQNGLLKPTSILTGFFGEKTKVVRGLEESKEELLKPRFAGRTVLDIKKLRELFNSQGMLVCTISDGYWDNWKSQIGGDETKVRPLLRDEFIKMAKKHFYFHLQIGEKNEFSQDLEEAGLPVHYVLGNHDLARKLIEITDKLYRG